MQLPPKSIIDSIDDFCVLFFKDKDHSDDAPPHFYLTFPINNNLSLIICIFTSQIEKQRHFYNKANKKALRCLLTVNNNIFKFLSRNDSIIDCNQAKLLSKEELIKRIDIRRYRCDIKTRKVPEFIKRDVRTGIIRSPLIEKRIKKIIKAME